MFSTDRKEFKLLATNQPTRKCTPPRLQRQCLYPESPPAAADKNGYIALGKIKMKTIITLLCTASIAWAAEMASGTVFNDANGNGQREPDEKGLRVWACPMARRLWRRMDGRWQLPVTGDTILFVFKPSGWMTPLNAHKLPQFHYIHKPKAPAITFPREQADGAVTEVD